MASPSEATAGVLGNLYMLRPNGFKGSGLNDLTWGAASSVSDSFHIEIVIDGTGTPDTFKWRENGGAWTEDVAITGASQNIVGTNGTQAVTFTATTGHTAADQWVIGNLYAEPTTESTNTAQITDTDLRLINPNSPPTWTDSGGKTVVEVNYAAGKATFSGTVDTVTVAGNDGYVLKSGMQQVGDAEGFTFTGSCQMLETTPQGATWDTFVGDCASLTGTIDKFFIANRDFFEAIEDNIDGSQLYFLLELYWYDPDQDQTGDHIDVWITFTNETIRAAKKSPVMANIGFTAHGGTAFTANG